MKQLSPPTQPRSRDSERRASTTLLLVGLFGLVVTFAMYEPQRKLPFAIEDFSEFLPLLHRPSIEQQWDGFLQYYGSLGRWNPFAYATLVLKWTLFGTNASAWHLTRFAELWFLVGITYLILRRFGATMWGAAAGAGLFTVAGPAQTAWLRLTMGEPLGLCFLLPALLAATHYRSAARWRSHAVAIALCIALAVLTKEMLVAFVPFIVAVGCCYRAPSVLARPVADDRTYWLLGGVGVACAATLIPVAVVAHHAPPSTFVSGFTIRRPDASVMASNFAHAFLPVSWFGGFAHALAPGNIVFLTLAGAAARVIWRHRRDDGISINQIVAWVALSLSLPLLLVVAYEPWYSILDFYALPYLLGAAMILAGAVSVLVHFAPSKAWLVYAGCTAILVSAGMHAVRAAGDAMARRQVYGAVAEYLAEHERGVPVVMRDAVSPNPMQRWQDLGPTLGRYAVAVYPTAGLLAIRDTNCVSAAANSGVDASAGVVLTDVSACGTMEPPTVTFGSTYQYFALAAPWLKRDTVEVELSARRSEP